MGIHNIHVSVSDDLDLDSLSAIRYPDTLSLRRSRVIGDWGVIGDSS
jgi:hypothetical protein